MRVKLIKDCEGPSGKLLAGTVVDHPKAGALIELGLATPECEASRELAVILGAREKAAEAERRRKRQLAEEATRAERRRQFAAELGLDPAEVEAALEAAKPATGFVAGVPVEVPPARSRKK